MTTTVGFGHSSAASTWRHSSPPTAFPKKILIALTEAVKLARDLRHTFGFNEWILPQGPVPRGQGWQTWSAAMDLYAEECVRLGTTPFFDRK
jgi:hypothetical protein